MIMRIIADENVHRQVVDTLRQAHHEVEWLAETSSGISDLMILTRSDIGDRLLITYDRDFGQLIFKEGLAAPLGIVYSRLGRSNPDFLAQRVLELIAADRVANRLTVVERSGERVKALPKQRQK